MFEALIMHKIAVAFIVRTDVPAKKCEYWLFDVCSLAYIILSSLGIFSALSINNEARINEIIVVMLQAFSTGAMMYIRYDVLNSGR